ncbi:MAG: metalloregulator ArsR/SmtB family transcription factor [Alphaproteobacteria bacterium]|nr:metalloregulator ArsR/SmtB family transcription factor [Alphaproteobacteria bacterium]
MESKAVLKALAALAQETRLSIFRTLVAAGPDGLAAGRIAEALDVAAPTLSFHLKELEQAGLISSRRASRHILYAPNFGAMRGVVAFLMEDCCQGHPEVCGVASSAAGCGPASSKDQGDRAPRARQTAK